MKFLSKIISSLAIVAAFLLSACFNTPYYADTASKIDDTTWIPVYVLGQESLTLPSTDPSNREAYLHFVHRGYGRFIISGKGGVNSFTGSMDHRDDQSVIFTLLASTLKIGQNYAYEAKFLEALKGTQTIEMSGDTMSLYKKDGTGKVLLMKLQKVAR